MRPPRWDDPIGSACREAEPTILRGLRVRPTLYGFVDREPVIRVQPGLARLGGDGAVASAHLAAVPAFLDLEQALLFCHVRTSDMTIDDEHLRDALASDGIIVEVARRDDDEVATETYLVEAEVADGEVRWQRPQPLPEGGWTALLRQALVPPAAVTESPMDAATLAYALSRAGTVVEVAPGWRERFGTTRLDRRRVRPEDRRRARELVRPRHAAATRRDAWEVGA